MAITRPFAYNTGSAISGFEQLGNLTIGKSNGGGNLPSSLKWWNGPDEDPGYVIARQDPTGRIGADGETSEVEFWRTDLLTDQSFIDLGNKLLASNHVTASDVKTALNGAGFWTSYTVSTGGSSDYQLTSYFLSNLYEPASNVGDITFPSHPFDGVEDSGYASINPNLVGQEEHPDEFGLKAGTFRTMLYINSFSSDGATDNTSALEQLIGNSGQLKLTQGSDFVVYGFTEQAFNQTGGNAYKHDNLLSGAGEPFGSLTLITPSAGDFNTTDPITIDITID